MRKRVYGICPYDCPTSCGFYAEVEEGKLLGLAPDPEHPVNKGLICGKMRHYERGVNREDRILTPLLRTGEKGSGSFAPISWEEALGRIAEQWKKTLKEEGPDAFAYLYYSGVMSQIQRFSPEALMNRLGARPMVATLCSTPKGSGYSSVVGGTGCLDPRELKDSDLVILWSCHTAATRLQALPILRKLKSEGKRILQVDVYGEPNASLAEESFLIRPGSDGALALALLHELSAAGKEDREFLRANAEGLEKFEASLSSYTPEWAAPITGLSPDRIRRLAEAFSSVKAPAILLGSGFSRYGNGGMNARLITILSLWTGAWQYPGGGLCGTNPTGGAYVGKNLAARPDFRTHEGPAFNINLAGPLLERREKDDKGIPPVKCLYVWGCNPANSVSDSGAVLRGLSREDLFTVVHERTMTDTARYADIILPATYSVEQSDIYTSYGYCTLGCAYRAVPAPGECRSNWDTTCLLAKAMGIEDPFFRQTEEEMVSAYLESVSPLVKEQGEAARKTLREGGVISLPYADHTDWKTPSGKIRLRDESLVDPLPCYRPCFGAEEKTAWEEENGEWLQLISVPSDQTLNTVFAEREDLLARRGEPVLVLNPKDAKKRGIGTGDRVLCRNDLGEVILTARVTGWIAEGAVAAIGVYGSETALKAEGEKEISLTGNGEKGAFPAWINFLHHARLSDLGAATTMNDNLAEVLRLS